MRVFLDANILWSAAHHRGAIRVLLERLVGDGHILVVDGYVVDEALRNLPATRHANLSRLLETMELNPPPASAGMDSCHGLPAKDAPVLRAAIELGCGCLVTGDRRHFGHLMGARTEGVLVLAPAEALSLLSR